MKPQFSTMFWASAAALFFFFPLPAFAGEDLGEKLIRSFFADSASRNHAAIEKILAPSFQSVHTDGVRDRAAELELIRNIKLGTHTLANFKTTRNDSVLVVTFEVNASSEVLAGKTVAQGSYPRMAVWQDTDSGWQLVAYANFAPLKQ